MLGRGGGGNVGGSLVGGVSGGAVVVDGQGWEGGEGEDEAQMEGYRHRACTVRRKRSPPGGS